MAARQNDGAGYARLCSGRTGLTLNWTFGFRAGDNFGSSITMCGDLNGDGRPDLLVRDRLYSVPSQWVGQVRAYSLVDLPLRSDRHVITASSGGTQTFFIDAGPSQAGRTYLVGGTTAGTTPGLPVGGLTIPLNPSPYFFVTLQSPNQPPLMNTLGTLDAMGTATAAFVLPPVIFPPGSSISGHHALGVLDVGGVLALVSPAVPLTITPSSFVPRRLPPDSREASCGMARRIARVPDLAGGNFPRSRAGAASAESCRDAVPLPWTRFSRCIREKDGKARRLHSRPQDSSPPHRRLLK